MRVLDFGAGKGLITSQVVPLVKKILAVDISEAMLNKLASKLDLCDKVEVVCQDIIHKAITEKFDLIMSVMAMHYVKDTSRLVQKFSEHLSPGALIALADLDKEDGSFNSIDTEGVLDFRFERDQLQIILEKHRFREIKFIIVYTINEEGKKYPVFLVTATKINLSSLSFLQIL